MNEGDPHGLILCLFDQLEEGLEEIADQTLLELSRDLVRPRSGTATSGSGRD